MTPSYLLMIADQMERAGLDPAHSSPRIAVLGAEPWTDAMRREIERRMDLDACDIYGLSEVMGPGVACECVETKDGPTLWEDHFYPEVIDPVDGTVLPDGRVGELVLTSLTKQAMPVIRYRTGDLTRLLPGTARTMRRIEKITGRGDDMMIVRGVNLFPTQVEEQVLQVHGLAPHFQCLITRPGRLDELTLRVEEAEAHPDGQHPDGQRPAAAAAELCRRMKETFGVSVRTELLPPGTLERSGGKAQRVRDERLPCPEAPETAAPETAAGPEAAAGRAE